MLRLLHAPCKDCTDRIYACHSTCDRYKAYKEELAKRNKRHYERKNKYPVDK